jgi:hypothetical protein
MDVFNKDCQYVQRLCHLPWSIAYWVKIHSDRSVFWSHLPSHPHVDQPQAGIHTDAGAVSICGYAKSSRIGNEIIGFYIHNPLSGLFATHPPIEKRIEILERMC